ncbi:sensor domain-containing diguanylate cyclase [Lysinibacillus sp. 54212]|uniref:sensor domain-containing diguanylate cyclase n=1 Tax=Lysinibacillus sp. 54212 TaxID=3119829 RepID=UPI002FC6C8F5
MSFSQAILDSLPDNIAVVNNAGIILAVNKSWINFSEENSGNLCKSSIGTNYLNVCQKEVKDGISLVLSGSLTQYTFEYPCHDENQLRWFLLRATPIKVDDFAHYGAVISHVNITDRKIAELQLAQKEKRYRLITENSTDFISIHTIKSVFTFASPICESVLGYDTSELIGKSLFDLLHPEDRKKIQQFFELSINQHEVQTALFRIGKKNKEYIWFETKCKYIHSPEDNEEEIICISRDVTAQQLKLIQLEAEKKSLQKAIYTDELTGIYNRRLFNKLLQEQFVKLEQFHHNFSLLMIDIDYFKQYNDTYGHPQGDQCLYRVANTIKQEIRENDLVFRIGGEEFCVFLPKTTKRDAISLANRLRKCIESLNIPHASSSASPFITISIGVSTFTKNEGTKLDAQSLIKKADRALYKAKEKGRNIVIAQ